MGYLLCSHYLPLNPRLLQAVLAICSPNSQFTIHKFTKVFSASSINKTRFRYIPDELEVILWDTSTNTTQRLCNPR